MYLFFFNFYLLILSFIKKNIYLFIFMRLFIFIFTYSHIYLISIYLFIRLFINCFFLLFCAQHGNEGGGPLRSSGASLVESSHM